MLYVLCPNCNLPVELPDNAIGPKRSDPWNVVRCDECGTTFDYDDDEVQTSALPPESGD